MFSGGTIIRLGNLSRIAATSIRKQMPDGGRYAIATWCSQVNGLVVRGGAWSAQFLAEIGSVLTKELESSCEERWLWCWCGARFEDWYFCLLAVCRYRWV